MTKRYDHDDLPFLTLVRLHKLYAGDGISPGRLARLVLRPGWCTLQAPQMSVEWQRIRQEERFHPAAPTNPGSWA